MGKEINVDILQSQYIRAECFLMLSQILDTPVLFDDAKRKIGELPVSQNERYSLQQNIYKLKKINYSLYFLNIYIHFSYEVKFNTKMMLYQDEKLKVK
jgi:hypothetical protein